MANRFPLFAFSLKVVGVAWLIVGLIMLLVGGFRSVEGLASLRWPHVEGVIVNSSFYPIRDSSGKVAFYKANITYAYSVPAQNGSTSGFQNNCFSSRRFGNPFNDSYTRLADVQHLTQRFHLDRHVEVFYNQYDPAESFLEPGVSSGTFASSIVGIFLVVFGPMLLIISNSIFKHRADY